MNLTKANPNFRLCCWLIGVIGVIVPRRLRADWRQEWEAELHWRAQQLAEWETLAWRAKLALFWHSVGALADALWLQTRRWEDEIMQDVRFGGRLLRQQLGFSGLAILALALGIGANTALFSVVDSLWLRPLPYRGAERLVRIMESSFKQRAQWEGWNRAGVSQADFRAWQRRSQSFEELAAVGGWAYRVAGQGEAQISAKRVSANLFSFLGVTPALGRTFQAADEQPERERVVILSHQYWVERCGANPHAIGQQLLLDEQPHTIVGVLPADFRDYFNYYARLDRERFEQLMPLTVNERQVTQLWTPILATPEALNYHGPSPAGGHGSYQVLGRLKPGVTQQQAQAEMDGLAAQLAQQYPSSNADIGAAVFSLHEEVTGSSRRMLLLLSGAFALIWLIACANVASLLLARGLERSKELAIRATLGAGLWRVLRQLLTECLLLASFGGALGLLLAYGLVSAIRPLIPADIPRSDAVTLDERTLLFTLALLLLTTLLAGLLPAWQLAKLNLAEELKEAGRSAVALRRSQTWRKVLVIGQVALTMILLAGAGLLTHSFVRLQRLDVGFATDNLARVMLAAPRPEQRRSIPLTQPTAEDRAEWQEYWQPLLERARRVPGVQQAALTTGAPLQGFGLGAHIGVPGRLPVKDAPRPLVYGEAISPDYLATLGLAVKEGRSFNTQDSAETAPVVIVNESFARSYFPNQSAVGQTVLFHYGTKLESAATVVGVVSDARSRLEQPVAPYHFLPLTQVPLRRLNLLIRTTGEAAPVLAAVANEVPVFNPSPPFSAPATLEQVRARYLIKPRFYWMLVSSVAALALILAATGIYGTLYLTVRQRRHEIGVRRALGAEAGDILRLVLRQGVGLAAVGLLLGLGGAVALMRFIRGWLFEISPTEPWTLTATALLLLVVALGASWWPARRALQEEPLSALRRE